MICPLRMGMGIHWLLRMRINRLGQGRMGMEIIGVVCIRGMRCVRCGQGERRRRGDCVRGQEHGRVLCLGDRPFGRCTRSSIGSGGARIGLCAFTGLLPSPIRVVIGGSLTIQLTDVLGHKRTIDFTMGALLPAGLPHSRGRLRPAMLIGGNIFFFREPGAILICCHQEHEGTEPRLYHID